MSHDWLLVETLGSEPVVVAQGQQLKNLVPIDAFLRRSPHLAAVRSAIADTVAGATSLASITPKGGRVIRTEPVVMSDGRVHGVHVWTGPADAEPPARAVAGPLVWNLTTGVATDTPESLSNSGLNPAVEATHDRSFAEDLPARNLNATETKVLSMAVSSYPGATFANVWEVTDYTGAPIAVAFVARANLESAEDGAEHLIARAMNWRTERDRHAEQADSLPQRILDGLAQPGTYRALVDLKHWQLLKWLDEPCPLYNWRGATGINVVHPDDLARQAAMTDEFASGAAAGVLRLRGHDTGWVPLHVTVNRVQLDDDVYAGLITIRPPTDAELDPRQ